MSMPVITAPAMGTIIPTWMGTQYTALCTPMGDQPARQRIVAMAHGVLASTIAALALIMVA